MQINEECTILFFIESILNAFSKVPSFAIKDINTGNINLINEIHFLVIVITKMYNYTKCINMNI